MVISSRKREEIANERADIKVGNHLLLGLDLQMFAIFAALNFNEKLKIIHETVQQD